MNHLFFNTYDQEEEYIENAIALCDNIKYKISKYIETTCPCRSCIQRLHYPAFSAFFLLSFAKLSLNLNLN